MHSRLMFRSGYSCLFLKTYIFRSGSMSRSRKCKYFLTETIRSTGRLRCMPSRNYRPYHIRFLLNYSDSTVGKKVIQICFCPKKVAFHVWNQSGARGMSKVQKPKKLTKLLKKLFSPFYGWVYPTW